MNQRVDFSRHEGYIPVLQLGDPTLRRKCAEVPVEKIKGKEVKDVLAAMHAALIRYPRVLFVLILGHRYDGVGLSAPQVGVALQILMVQVR